jgi:8-oxo-dGTP pyrophosphatase MutT (NUDIX family)
MDPVTWGELDHPRRAAVLILLYPDPATGEDMILFTRRTETLPSHRGQISFPGGSIDPTDSHVVAAALREAAEEVGLDPELVTVLGTLPEVYTVVSNYLIMPVVGRTLARPVFLPNPAEVAELIEVPLAGLRDPAIHRVEAHLTLRGPVDVHYYQYGPYNIWGATARILYTFLHGAPPVRFAP